MKIVANLISSEKVIKVIVFYMSINFEENQKLLLQDNETFPQAFYFLRLIVFIFMKQV